MITIGDLTMVGFIATFSFVLGFVVRGWLTTTHDERIIREFRKWEGRNNVQRFEIE